jgi:hypothetical protein
VPAGILREAEAARAGLVVIGAGQSRIRRRRRAGGAVRERAGAGRSAGGRAGGVLGATDLSDPAVPAVEAAAR